MTFCLFYFLLASFNFSYADAMLQFQFFVIRVYRGMKCLCFGQDSALTSTNTIIYNVSAPVFNKKTR